MVVVLTWNANNSQRWSYLWQNKFVLENNWEVICLQEAGNPAPEWKQITGLPWGANTKLDVVFRKYTYTDLLSRSVNIIHCEWVKRQKNHTVMITKPPAYPISIAGDVGIRPCLGVLVKLTHEDKTTKKAILGCVHIVSSDKAAAEVQEMLKFIECMVREKRADGWLLFGDFNANPNKVKQTIGARGETTFWPGQTHRNETKYPLDYGAFNKLELLTTAKTQSLWYPADDWGSDHRMMKYEQVDGPTITFLPTL